MLMGGIIGLACWWSSGIIRRESDQLLSLMQARHIRHNGTDNDDGGRILRQKSGMAFCFSASHVVLLLLFESSYRAYRRYRWMKKCLPLFSFWLGCLFLASLPISSKHNDNRSVKIVRGGERVFGVGRSIVSLLISALFLLALCTWSVGDIEVGFKF